MRRVNECGAFNRKKPCQKAIRVEYVLKLCPLYHVDIIVFF